MINPVWIPQHPKWVELPSEHSFIDALTALIEEVDTPEMYEDFDAFADRFDPLVISTSSDWAEIEFPPKQEFIAYIKEGRRALGKSEHRWSYLSGVEQRRRIHGNSLMILGHCFQKGGPVSSAEAVFRTWKKLAKKAASRT